MIVYDLNQVARDWSGHTPGESWKDILEVLLVGKVRGDGPPCLSLPPVIVNHDLWEMLMNPPYGVGVTPLSHKVEGLQGAGVIFLYVFTFVVLFLHDSHGGGGYIESFYLKLLNDTPEGAWVRNYWLAFKEHRSSSSDQRSINYEAVPDDPADITAGEPHVASADIEYVLHGPVEGDDSAASVSHNTLWCTCGSRGVY